MAAVVPGSEWTISTIELEYVCGERVGDLKGYTPRGDLVAGLGGIYIEESDKCAVPDVSDIANLQLTRGVRLGVPEGIPEAEGGQTRRIDGVRR